MITAAERYDAEIAKLNAEIRTVEVMPPTIAERFAVVERELRDAEALYRTHGVNVSAAHPDHTAYLQRQALIGFGMVIGADKALKAERERIEAQGEGLTAADKSRKLDELRRSILRVAAQRELEVRKLEGHDLEDEEFRSRTPVHGELEIWRRSDLERLAAGR